jgi:hypothetical protein
LKKAILAVAFFLAAALIALRIGAVEVHPI